MYHTLCTIHYASYSIHHPPSTIHAYTHTFIHPYTHTFIHPYTHTHIHTDTHPHTHHTHTHSIRIISKVGQPAVFSAVPPLRPRPPVGGRGGRATDGSPRSMRKRNKHITRQVGRSVCVVGRGACCREGCSGVECGVQCGVECGVECSVIVKTGVSPTSISPPCGTSDHTPDTSHAPSIRIISHHSLYTHHLALIHYIRIISQRIRRNSQLLEHSMLPPPSALLEQHYRDLLRAATVSAAATTTGDAATTTSTAATTTSAAATALTAATATATTE
jgi:hypothetical protein